MRVPSRSRGDSAHEACENAPSRPAWGRARGIYLPTDRAAYSVTSRVPDAR